MTEQPEWLSKYGIHEGFPLATKELCVDLHPDGMTGTYEWSQSDADRLINALVLENDSLNDRIARLEAGQRELEARLGDDGK